MIEIASISTLILRENSDLQAKASFDGFIPAFKHGGKLSPAAWRHILFNTTGHYTYTGGKIIDLAALRLAALSSPG